MQNKKRLGRGGSKRSHKVLRPTTSGITPLTIRRLARKGGLTKVSGINYDSSTKKKYVNDEDDSKVRMIAPKGAKGANGLRKRDSLSWAQTLWGI